MDRFVANFTLRLDSKGRVSIPWLVSLGARPRQLRGPLLLSGAELPCDRRRWKRANGGDRGPDRALCAVFGPARTVGAALHGTSETLKIDGEGRVVLSENLKRHAGITETVAFVGLGHKFQIWEPGRFQKELAEATQKVRALKGELSFQVAARNALALDFSIIRVEFSPCQG